MDSESTNNDHLKVFVSRLPSKWTQERLKEHFEACFGKVIDSYIRMDQANENSMGFGFVTFEAVESKAAAVAQGSMHVGHRTVQIRDVSRAGKDGESGTTDNSTDNICFAWQKFNCVKGDACKFKHVGPGKCITVSAFGEGKSKKCMSFKKTGKCSKGDSCPFQHIRSRSAVESAKNATTVVVTAPVVTCDTKKDKGLCHSFAKKGKCRKGDACMFSHDVPARMSKISSTESDAAVDTVGSNGGKRKINGKVLVEKRRKMLAETDAGAETEAGSNSISITGDE